MKFHSHFLVLSILLLSFKAEAQHFGQKAMIGNSLYFHLDFIDSGAGSEITYSEFSWNKYIAVQLAKDFYFGINHISIFGNYNSSVSTQIGSINTFVTGAYFQYRFSPIKQLSLRALTGVSIGNHCTCGNADPVSQANLKYFNWGLGLDTPIFKNLRASLEFKAHLIQNDIALKYGYTGAFAGLEYHFGKND